MNVKSNDHANTVQLRDQCLFPFSIHTACVCLMATSIELARKLSGSSRRRIILGLVEIPTPSACLSA
ncbi:hypothetical protein T4E_3419 [Trichinella pseudospiralis]|uniref:Uncharacterized protein n=1 Tax=Trichinella pseudospiralis TaxID=6337 RepID=A0A0V0YH90_TRIPS|nr:hypothetical protein T4E_3419 [Trichinella pseudospiralis]